MLGPASSWTTDDNFFFADKRKWWQRCHQKKFAFLHMHAHVEIYALFGVPADFIPMEWIAWKPVTDERMDTQSYTRNLTTRGGL